MNKTEFINELSSRLSYSKDKCIIINDVLENNFFISEKNKEKIIEQLILNLGIDNEEAMMIYEIATKIIKDEVKDKLKHPFRNQD